MSCVTCHNFFLLLLFFGQSGEAYRSRVCYQRGIPRLVSYIYIYIILVYLANVDKILDISHITLNVKETNKKSVAVTLERM